MRLKDALGTSESTVGFWITIGHPTVAEVLTQLDFDFGILEHEHAPNDIETLANLLRGCETIDGDLDVLVRLAWNDPAVIKRTLDLGVQGVIVPMIETAEGAREAVAAAKYPPEGRRGVAGSRANAHGLETESGVAHANEHTIVIAQIETEKGVENADAISAVEGLDGVFIGPADLSATVAQYGEWDDATFEAAIERIVAAAHDSGTAVGTVGAGESIRSRVRWDVDFIVAGTDISYLRSGGRDARRTAETALGE